MFPYLFIFYYKTINAFYDSSYNCIVDFFDSIFDYILTILIYLFSNHVKVGFRIRCCCLFELFICTFYL